MMGLRSWVFAVSAAVALAVTASACAASADRDSEGERSTASDSDAALPLVTYCAVARDADFKIGAELAEFDPNTVTPAVLERLLSVAVAEWGKVAEAAPAELAAELQLLSERWQHQQGIFAEAGYVFADAPPDVMDLEGEQREAFDRVAAFNSDECSIEALGENNQDHDDEHEHDHTDETGDEHEHTDETEHEHDHTDDAEHDH